MDDLSASRAATRHRPSRWKSSRSGRRCTWGAGRSCASSGGRSHACTPAPRARDSSDLVVRLFPCTFLDGTAGRSRFGLSQRAYVPLGGRHLESVRYGGGTRHAADRALSLCLNVSCKDHRGICARFFRAGCVVHRPQADEERVILSPHFRDRSLVFGPLPIAAIPPEGHFRLVMVEMCRQMGRYEPRRTVIGYKSRYVIHCEEGGVEERGLWTWQSRMSKQGGY
ncbi:uncharacterized protein B0H18DRAFT_1056061 [Fomitopsis serialis]|uniref:uncharacterized protein n=1 Tax=Fomitopsis serialis TaxID=139415 RepID=UPI0020084651|nr:uncharacterized protein B0H18DRAFT_1056061 [Neoantrodia serialis]KAH9912126.1 hypothetical protein B0H18DRAFT_1056061 [Neoantrodia serialis]